MVAIKLGNDEKEIEFLLDTGATYSVLNQKLIPEDEDFVTVIGATGGSEKAFFLRPLQYKLGKQIGIHKFLYLPESPKSLLGRDLLEQLEAEISFKRGKAKFKIKEKQLIDILSLALIEVNEPTKECQEIINQVYPGVWATEVPGGAKNAAPVLIKSGEKPVRIKQYPLRLEDKKGIKEIIDKFLYYGLLTECESEYNTPILPVKAADGKSYRLVQDLRAINRIVEDLHSAAVEEVENRTTDALIAVQEEMRSPSKEVLQNRMALDTLLASQGGVCSLINEHCCSYIDQNGRISTDLEEIWKQIRVLHEVTKDDTSWGFTDIWNKLTSWLPNLQWLKEIFMTIVMILILGIFICILFQCLMQCWATRNGLI